MSAAIVGILMFVAVGSAGSLPLAFIVLAGFLFMPFTKLPVGILGTGAVAGEKTADEILLEKIKSQVTDILNGKSLATNALLDSFKTKLEGLDTKALDVQAIKDEVITMQAKLKSMAEGGAQSMVGKSIRDQIKSYISANQEKFNSFKKGESKAFEIPIDVKSATTMLESNALGGSSYLPYREIVPGFTEIARNRPFIEAYANSSNTGSPNIVWVNKVNQEGTAAMTAEGAIKSLIDFNFETENSTARKVTDYIKVSTEMLEDIDFVAAAIENELLYQVDIKVDDQLLTGGGTGQDLKGVTEYAGAFVLTTLETTSPNNADAIMAAATQIQTLNFDATYAFVNPIDAANMQLTKDSQGNYVIPPFQSADGLTISGLKVVKSNQIDVGNLLVADMSKYIVRNYKPFTIQYGWENDDLTKNLVTIVGERRLHAYASNNNTGAFVYDTFDNIKTAITTV